VVTNFPEEPAASILYLEMEAVGSSETVVNTHCLVAHLNVTAGCNIMCMLSALQ